MAMLFDNQEYVERKDNNFNYESFDAEEARRMVKVAEEKWEEDLRIRGVDQYKKIVKLVKEAAEAMNSFVYVSFDGVMIEYCFDKLTSKGFSIKNIDMFNNEHKYEISWNK
jgi:hypothetical protein